MADRSVTVRLKIDNSDFLTGLAAASAGARAFKKDIEGADADFGRTLVHIGDNAKIVGNRFEEASRSARGFGNELRSTERKNKGFLASINASNDRMSFLVQTGLALGPALIPTFAALTPVVTGFGTALGFTAASAGVAVLAFSGVGDALKALNDYSTDPTVAHLEAMREAMDKIGPAGQDFVRFLQEIRPEMQALQDAAQGGLLPGVQEGITEVMGQLPLLEEVVTSLATAMGDVAAETGEALGSPFWTGFLEYLRDDGQQILTDFASALGHLVEGLAAMTQAFSPLSADFVSGFDDMARSFSGWAQGLDENQGFQDFVDYIREAGPELLDVVDALAEAIVALGHAGAGIGLASLEVIQRFLEGLANVLESPLGPWLLGIAAGLSAISRAVALYRIVAGQALLGLLGGLTGKGAAGGAAGATGAAAVLGSLEKIGYARIAAGLALVATSTTDLGDSLEGVENTANFGLLGFLLKGKLGGAIGATVGAALDLAAANTTLQDSFDTLDEALSTPADFTGQTDALEALKAKIDEMRADFVTGDDGDLNPLDDLQNMVQGWFGESNLEKAQRVYDEAVAQKEQFLDEYLATVPGNPFGNLFDPTGTAAGAAAAIAGIIPAAESAEGRTSDLSEALDGLDNDLLTTADSAEAFGAALDALLDPNLNVQEATDAFAAGLDDWRKEISKASNALYGQTDAARKNRDSLRSRTKAVAQVKAEADAGDSRRKVTRSMVELREKLLDEADAIGLNVDAVNRMVDKFGLNDKLLDRLFEKKHEIKVDNRKAVSAVDDVMGSLQDLNVFDAEPSVTLAGADAVVSAIARIQGALNALNIFDATPSVTAPSSDFNLRRQPLPKHADGGLILGPGGPRSDSVPILASNGEFVVNAAATRENLALLRSINAKKFASGGRVGRNVSAADISRSAFRSDLPATLEQLVRLLAEMSAEAKDVVEAEQDVKAAREAARNASRQLAQTEDTSSQLYRDRARASREADKDLERAESDLSKQREQLARATDLWKQKQAELIDQAAAVQQGILGSGALLGGEGTSVTVGGILAKIREAARDGAQFRRDIARIRALGIDESVVQELLEGAGTPEAEAAAHNLADASRRQVRQVNAAQHRLERVAVASGRGALPQGGGGISVTLTGDITTTDVTRLPAGIEKRIRRAVRVAVQR